MHITCREICHCGQSLELNFDQIFYHGIALIKFLSLRFCLIFGQFDYIHQRNVVA